MDAFLRKQPSLVDVAIPDDGKFTVCGDIHGQYYDLMNIFEKNGLPSPTNPYLFNGDFVDRGSFSVECIFTLFGFKLLYPNHFFMSRGKSRHPVSLWIQKIFFSSSRKPRVDKHEPNVWIYWRGYRKIQLSRNIFYHEACADKSQISFPGSTMADMFTQVYNFLPLCHLLNNRVLVMHGGLFSSDEVTIDDLRAVERNRQPPEEGIMCELLWSDPQPQTGRSPSKRGVGCQFGECSDFLSWRSHFNTLQHFQVPMLLKISWRETN